MLFTIVTPCFTYFFTKSIFNLNIYCINIRF
nr:MAG TPA: hypothetical protein [Caudoviricetes sp.]